MVGYVRIFKSELKIKEYEAYRGVYCSLCKTLGKEYGVLSRMLLSYDVTFLSVVLLSQKGNKPAFKQGRCPFNLLKKCNYCRCDYDVFSFAAAVTVLMFYYKLRDDICDGVFFKKLLAFIIYPYAFFLRKKVLKKYERLDSVIKASMDKQQLCEKENTSSVDVAAHNSADALGKIFSYFSNSDQLYRLGYLVGRWVYLIDAADDLLRDIKSNSFNVFRNLYSISTVDDVTDTVVDDITGILNMCQGVLAEAYLNLEAGIFSPIIENVIFESFSNTISEVSKGIVKK